VTAVSALDETRDRALRRGAQDVGMRVRKWCHVYELRNGDGLVLAGTWASVGRYVRERYGHPQSGLGRGCGRRRRGRPRSTTTSPRWSLPAITPHRSIFLPGWV
jgi:hypothetical protein